jgi:hypothetical protein
MREGKGWENFSRLEETVGMDERAAEIRAVFLDF